jgi:hypothetical protein
MAAVQPEPWFWALITNNNNLWSDFTSASSITPSGDRGSTVSKILRYKSEGRWFDPRWCHWNFSVDIDLLIALWPEGSTQLLTVFPLGKYGRCVRLTTLPPSFAVVKKSGNCNILEPSGPSQAYKSTGLGCPRGFQEVRVPRFLHNGKGWW